jgi:hypothetical protein
MKRSPAKPGHTTAPSRFGDAFAGGGALGAAGRELLLARLEAPSHTGDDRLFDAELGDINDPKRRQELRSWFESAFALGWDRALLDSHSLGDLAPPARLVADGRIAPRSLQPRLRLLLERAGYVRWSELLDVTFSQLCAGPHLGPTTMAAVLGACFERSLIGLCTGEQHDGSELAVLLAEERRSPEQPVLEALLEAAASREGSLAAPGADRAGSRRATAARGLLEAGAPWALEPAVALVELLSGITNEQDRSIFVRTELATDRRASRSELAAELDVSSTRVAQRRERAAAQLREELTAAPAPLGWRVRRFGRSLGRVATADAVMAELGVHGLGSVTSRPGAPEATQLLLWLAGPFEPVARCPGWLGVRPDELVARTRECLIEDGGVVSFLTVGTALEGLGVNEAAVIPWLEACGGVVVDGELTVWLSGPLLDVVERLMDAHGRSLTADQCGELLRRGSRLVAQSELERVLQNRRFRPADGDAYELATWPPAPTGEVNRGRNSSQGTAQARPERPEVLTRLPAAALQRKTFSPRPASPSLSDPARSDPALSDPGEQLGLPGVVTPSPRGAEGALWGAELVGDDTARATPGRAWLIVKVDPGLLRGDESSVPEGLVRALDLGLQQRRTFSSRFGPVMLGNDGPKASRGPLRPVAMGTGAGIGDTLVLGFAPEGDVVVEVRPDPGGERPISARTGSIGPAS